jgi:hypothetical protein
LKSTRHSASSITSTPARDCRASLPKTPAATDWASPTRPILLLDPCPDAPVEGPDSINLALLSGADEAVASAADVVVPIFDDDSVAGGRRGDPRQAGHEHSLRKPQQRRLRGVQTGWLGGTWGDSGRGGDASAVPPARGRGPAVRRHRSDLGCPGLLRRLGPSPEAGGSPAIPWRGRRSPLANRSEAWGIGRSTPVANRALRLSAGLGCWRLGIPISGRRLPGSPQPWGSRPAEGAPWGCTRISQRRSGVWRRRRQGWSEGA